MSKGNFKKRVKGVFIREKPKKKATIAELERELKKIRTEEKRERLRRELKLKKHPRYAAIKKGVVSFLKTKKRKRRVRKRKPKYAMVRIR